MEWCRVPDSLSVIVVVGSAKYVHFWLVQMISEMSTCVDTVLNTCIQTNMLQLLLFG